MGQSITVSTGFDQPDYLVKGKVGNHGFQIDEPLLQGGLNQAPSPFDILVQSLAGCTLITLRMYINHKLEGKTLASLPEISANLVYETDERNLKISLIKRMVTITANPDTAPLLDQDRLLLVANKCPVHNMLAPTVPIETSLDLIVTN